MTNPLDDDDLTEVTEMHTPRVDLVSKAANGTRFFLAKGEADPSMFTEADVIALAKAQEGDPMTDTAPGDLAKDADDPIDPTTDADAVDASGDPDDVDSAAWEAVDAENARGAIELAVALKRRIELAIDRESEEAALDSDDEDADENVWSLSGALDALDCIVGVLAPYAVGEQAEADERDASDGDDSIVLKSGRVLSGVNESRIRQAQELLGQVVGSLPAAEPEAVVKADDEQLTLVYTQGTGSKVLGAVKASNITTFAEPDAGSDDASNDGADDATDASDASSDDANATDSTTAPDAGDGSDAATIPGTNTVQSPVVTDDAEDATPVTKGLDSEVIKLLEGMSGALAKLASDKDDQASVIADLQEQVQKLAMSPDDRRSPLLNGGRGTAGIASRDGLQIDPLADLRKAVDDAKSPTEMYEAQARLASAALKMRLGLS